LRASSASTALLLLAACGGPSGVGSPRAIEVVETPATLSVELDADQRNRILRASPLPPPPADPTNAWADDPDAATLGQYLFFDERLSERGDTACATCHDPARSFSDGSVHLVSPGDHLRRTPRLVDVAQNRWFGWDGRHDTLWTQALAPLEAAREHGGSRLHVVNVLRRDPILRPSFEAVFGPLPPFEGIDGVGEHARPVPEDPDHPHQRAWDALPEGTRAEINRVFAQVGKALAAYERRLSSEPTPFDRFASGLRSGDADLVAALDERAQAGAELFFGRANCHACHDGPMFSDLEFHDNLLPFTDAGRPDRGRHLGMQLVRENPFNAQGAYSDAAESRTARKLEFLPARPRQYAEFKTPGLRNLDSGPFMHRGELADLDAVVRHYATLDGARIDSHGGERILKPLDLDVEDQAALVAFLESLRGGEPPQELLEQPSSAAIRQIAAR
jgi:cytochrome c peroxidase